MAPQKTRRELFEIAFRGAELCLIFITVWLMYKANGLVVQGLELQAKTTRLQNRPYLFLSTEKTELNKISDNEFEWTVYLKNPSSFPALNVRPYGLLIADGTPLYGLNCRPVRPTEHKGIFTSTETCNSSLPEVIAANQRFKVCVNNDPSPQAISPGSETPMMFTISKRQFHGMLNAKDKGTSGMFLVLTYEGLNDTETYVSNLGLLPYEVPSIHTYRFKIFAAAFK